MRSKLSDLKSLYTTLGGESTDVLSANSEIAVLNGILALGSVDNCQFIPDAIKAISDNFALIDPSPAATLIEKTVTANGTYNATSDSANGYSQVNVAVPVPETFEVTITNPETDVYTANKTYTETMAAIQNGDVVSFTVIEEDTTIEALGYFKFSDVGDTTAIMIVLIANPSSFVFLKWNSDNTIVVVV